MVRREPTQSTEPTPARSSTLSAMPAAAPLAPNTRRVRQRFSSWLVWSAGERAKSLPPTLSLDRAAHPGSFLRWRLRLGGGGAGSWRRLRTLAPRWSEAHAPPYRLVANYGRLLGAAESIGMLADACHQQHPSQRTSLSLAHPPMTARNLPPEASHGAGWCGQRWRRRVRRLIPRILVVLPLACSRSTLPDPQATVDAYVQAARSGDAEAVYALMTTEAQRTYGLEGTRDMVASSGVELQKQAEALSAEPVEVRTQAVIPFDDGERAVLVVEDGQFRVDAAQALPMGAQTPADALVELRIALARRSYAALLRVLSTESGAALEGDLARLVESLEDPRTLDVKVVGDQAQVSLPGGHSVRLTRESGVWKVEDFD